MKGENGLRSHHQGRVLGTALLSVATTAIGLGVGFARDPSWTLPPSGAAAYPPAHDSSDDGRSFAFVGGVYQNTGADSCGQVQVVEVPVGPRGSPIVTTILGSNATALDPDCPLFSSDPTWWEAFHIDSCARVTLDLCGTLPVQQPTYAVLFDACPCGHLILASTGARGGPYCADDKEPGRENQWQTFNALPPGTYYYPVFSDGGSLVSPRGPYQIHLTAEECRGGCCETASRVCEEDVGETQCRGAGQRFGLDIACCELECVPEEVPFDASGVELMSWVGFDRFPEGTHATSDLCRYVSPKGREYAIVGFTTGAGFVEFTRPKEPVVVGWIDGMGVDSIWRDPAAYNGYAYIVTDSIGVGLQVVELYFIDQSFVALVNTTRLLDDSFSTAHNIFVNEASGYAYLTGANYPTGGLTALDLSDPVNPTVAGWWSEYYVHDAQVVTLTKGANAGREIAFAFAGGEGVFILDVTDKTDMRTLSQLTYDGLSYCHQGWLSPDERYLFVDDELDELRGTVHETTTYVVDVGDLANPVLVQRFGNGGCAIDHDLMVRGHTVYEANYSTGLRVFDATDPLNPVEVGHFDTHPEDNVVGFVGAWGVEARFPSGIVAVADIDRGLFVVNYDCDDNGVADTKELAEGGLDCNANRFPDKCEFRVPGDLDRDRRVSVADQSVVSACVAAPCAGIGCAPANYSLPCCVHSDLDNDGDVDLRDVGAFQRAFTGR